MDISTRNALQRYVDTPGQHSVDTEALLNKCSVQLLLSMLQDGTVQDGQTVGLCARALRKLLEDPLVGKTFFADTATTRQLIQRGMHSSHTSIQMLLVLALARMIQQSLLESNMLEIVEEAIERLLTADDTEVGANAVRTCLVYARYQPQRCSKWFANFLSYPVLKKESNTVIQVRLLSLAVDCFLDQPDGPVAQVVRDLKSLNFLMELCESDTDPLRQMACFETLEVLAADPAGAAWITSPNDGNGWPTLLATTAQAVDVGSYDITSDVRIPAAFRAVACLIPTCPLPPDTFVKLKSHVRAALQLQVQPENIVLGALSLVQAASKVGSLEAGLVPREILEELGRYALSPGFVGSKAFCSAILSFFVGFDASYAVSLLPHCLEVLRRPGALLDARPMLWVLATDAGATGRVDATLTSLLRESDMFRRMLLIQEADLDCQRRKQNFLAVLVKAVSESEIEAACGTEYMQKLRSMLKSTTQKEVQVTTLPA